MHPNEMMIEHFYSSFATHDYAGMIALYAPNIEFSDPVFSLKGRSVGAMWHMLCESGKDLTITFKNIKADDHIGHAHWEAKYTFNSSGRKVLNIIEAQFQFENSQITQHFDNFNFWRWSHQAIGPAGTLLGWSPILQNKVKQTAKQRLNKFIAQHPEYSD